MISSGIYIWLDGSFQHFQSIPVSLRCKNQAVKTSFCLSSQPLTHSQTYWYIADTHIFTKSPPTRESTCGGVPLTWRVKAVTWSKPFTWEGFKWLHSLKPFSFFWSHFDAVIIKEMKPFNLAPGSWRSVINTQMQSVCSGKWRLQVWPADFRKPSANLYDSELKRFWRDEGCPQAVSFWGSEANRTFHVCCRKRFQWKLWVSYSGNEANSGLSVSGKELTQTRNGALTPAWNLKSVTMAT